MIKAIFFDVDGTLLSFDTHQIPESTFEALKQLKENGIKLFISTGRGQDGLGVLNNFPFDAYITLNGQYCFNDHSVIYENTIDGEDLKTLSTHLMTKPFPCGFTLEDRKFFNERDERVDEIHAITGNDDDPIGDFSNVHNEKVYQCMCFLDEQDEIELLSKLPNCISARWHPLFFDLSPLGGTKKNGMIEILKYYNIKEDETMAFGDGGNDIPMLEYAHISIAMGNAGEQLKAIADYVTDSVDDDGIANALKHYNLIK